MITGKTEDVLDAKITGQTLKTFFPHKFLDISLGRGIIVTRSLKVPRGATTTTFCSPLTIFSAPLT
jgi:hypothetical protein